MAITEGQQVMALISKRLRAHRKKYNRITAMEESMAQGVALNKEQKETLRSKPIVMALIEELEKLRIPPPSTDVSEEINLPVKKNKKKKAPTEKDVTEKEVTEKDVTEKEVTEKDVTEKEVTEKDVTEKEVTEKDVTEKEVTEKDVTEKEVTEKADVEDGKISDGLDADELSRDNTSPCSVSSQGVTPPSASNGKPKRKRKPKKPQTTN